MTPEQKIIQDLHRDLLFVLAHPMERCKVCKYRDKECTECVPSWLGDETNVKEYGKHG